MLERINFQELQRRQEDTRKILGVPALSLRPFTKGYLMENLPDPHCQSETSNAISLAFLMVFVVIFPCITIICSTCQETNPVAILGLVNHMLSGDLERYPRAAIPRSHALRGHESVLCTPELFKELVFMMNVRNIFSKVPECLPDEVFEDIITAEHCKIERIISGGHASPREGDWYDQEKNEWVMVIRGRAGLRFEGEDEITVMEPGDHIHIPAHRKHRVEWTASDQKTIWLAVHY